MTIETEPLDLAAGDWLFKQACGFARGVSRPDHLPPADRLEVAFAGRSNVGKSSLMNSLTSRKSLARTSHTPGRTRELNFFRLPDDKPGVYLVDLPGYGYAKAPKTAIAQWQGMMSSYLKGRSNLRRVFVLIDARHGIKAVDEPYFSVFDSAAVSYQIVLTKADKVKPAGHAALLRSTAEILRKHPAAHPRQILTSSVSGMGMPDLRAEIAGLIDLEALGYKGQSTQ